MWRHPCGLRARVGLRGLRVGASLIRHEGQYRATRRDLEYRQAIFTSEREIPRAVRRRRDHRAQSRSLIVCAPTTSTPGSLGVARLTTSSRAATTPCSKSSLRSSTPRSCEFETSSRPPKIAAGSISQDEASLRCMPVDLRYCSALYRVTFFQVPLSPQLTTHLHTLLRIRAKKQLRSCAVVAHQQRSFPPSGSAH